MRIEERFLQNEAIFNKKFENVTGNKQKDENVDKVQFGEVLKKTINEVNGKALESDAVTNGFIRGDDVNIDEVMIKGEEASLSLQFLAVTRDKLLEGYNELSKMQL